ncbi:MAG TPA: hypothetical protein ENH99_01935 [Candidatus Pacearchaeota archaeon]|nr:hypothetical protein [Candidatus Pacearchaeota archaeon]
MRKTLLVIMGALFGTFAFSGSTREADCSIYRKTQSSDPEHQFIVFDNGRYERGPGLNLDELESGEAYRAELKRYFSGLGREIIVDATPCKEQ